MEQRRNSVQSTARCGLGWEGDDVLEGKQANGPTRSVAWQRCATQLAASAAAADAALVVGGLSPPYSYAAPTPQEASSEVETLVINKDKRQVGTSMSRGFSECATTFSTKTHP